MNKMNNFDLSDVPVVVGTGLVALDVVINHTTDASQKVPRQQNSWVILGSGSFPKL